jgi:hypothetical protein
MNIDLTSLFPDLEALTPDGRWNMLQDWLSKNPEYGKRAKRWSTESEDQVVDEIRALVAKQYGPLVAAVLSTASLRQQLKKHIAILQACYRERAGQTETQLKAKKRRGKK